MKTLIVVYGLGAIATWVGLNAYTRLTLQTEARRMERVKEHQKYCYRCARTGREAGLNCDTLRLLMDGAYYPSDEEMEFWKRLAITVFWPLTISVYAAAFPLGKLADKTVNYLLKKEREERKRREAAAKEAAEAEKVVEEILKDKSA